MGGEPAGAPGGVLTTLRHPGVLYGGAFALIAIGGFVLPFLLIVTGIFVLATVGSYAVPELKPYVHELLRVPVARLRRRATHLGIIACVGLVMIASGVVGSSVRGKVRIEREQRMRRDTLVEERLDVLLEQARENLATGNVGRAELDLMDARKIAAAEGEDDVVDTIDATLGRMSRSRNSVAILETLVGLSPEEFDAFEAGEAVPRALEYQERALTLQAIELAHAQLPEARARRAAP